MPLAGVCKGVKVAVIHQTFEINLHRATRADERVLDEGGVFAMAHPDAFFEKPIGECIDPNGRGAFEMKTFDMLEPLWFDSAAGPAMGGEGLLRTIVAKRLVNRGDQLGPSQRGLQRGDQ